MKVFCRQCGEPLFGGPAHKKFCGSACCKKYNNATKPHTIANHFTLFKNIVAASATVEEFNEYWKKYFREDSHDDD